MLPFLLLIPVVAGMAIHDAERDRRRGRTEPDATPSSRQGRSGRTDTLQRRRAASDDDFDMGRQIEHDILREMESGSKRQLPLRGQKNRNQNHSEDYESDTLYDGYHACTVDNCTVYAESKQDLQRAIGLIEGLSRRQRRDFAECARTFHFIPAPDHPELGRMAGWATPETGEIVVASDGVAPGYVLGHEIGHLSGIDSEVGATFYGLFG